MMLRSAASPGSVGSAGRRWRTVASSYRCQMPTGPLLSYFLKFVEEAVESARKNAIAARRRRNCNRKPAKIT